MISPVGRARRMNRICLASSIVIFLACRPCDPGRTIDRGYERWNAMADTAFPTGKAVSLSPGADGLWADRHDTRPRRAGAARTLDDNDRVMSHPDAAEQRDGACFA